MTKNQYAERDAMRLDAAGGYYCRHVSAMTGEQLHSKGDIAAELGWRDMQIDRLREQVAKLTKDLAVYRNSYVPAISEALAAAQTTGLAFIRVNANGHVQVLPSDRVQMSVIQAVEERTTAAHCNHVWDKCICVNCGAIK